MSEVSYGENMTFTVAEDNVPVKPVKEQYNRYNMTLPKSFSVYNDEGNIIYRGEVEQVANEMRAELFGEKVEQQEEVKPVEHKGKFYDKKRGFFLVVPIILAIAIIALAVVGLFLQKQSVDQYISLYQYKLIKVAYVSVLDPAISLAEKLFKFDTGLKVSFVNGVKAEGLTYNICSYGTVAVTVIYFIFAIAMLIVAIVGAAGKKDEAGSYKKAKMGFLSIVMFICALALGVAGVFLTGGAAKDLIGFVTGKNDFSAGIGFYIMVAVPVVTFFCSCLAYRKKKA